MMPFLLVLGLVAPVGIGVGQDVPPQPSVAVETAAARLFNTTMSPYCPGLLLSNCPSPQAEVLRDRIRAQLAAGLTPDSIRAELLAIYGEQIRAAPRARGLGLVAWVVPGLVIFAGGVLLGVWIRRMMRRRAPDAVASARDDLAPEDRARLERELSAL